MTANESSSEDADRAEILRLVKMIPNLIVDTVLGPIRDGSRMAADQAATESLRLNLPVACTHYLGCSADFLDALHQLMLPSPEELVLPRFATYPLIRGAIEASGQTAWVIGPDQQRERVKRLLQILKSEQDYDGKTLDVQNRSLDSDSPDMRKILQANLRGVAPRRRMRWGWLLETAAGVGIDQTEFQHGVPGGYEALLRQAGDEQGLDGKWRGRSCAGGWMFVSGLSHPSFSRGFGGSISEPGELDGKSVVWLRANPMFVVRGLSMAVGFHMTAVMLWNRNSVPSAPGGDGS